MSATEAIELLSRGEFLAERSVLSPAVRRHLDALAYGRLLVRTVVLGESGWKRAEGALL
jgi:hypothetical protein